MKENALPRRRVTSDFHPELVHQPAPFVPGARDGKGTDAEEAQENHQRGTGPGRPDRFGGITNADPSRLQPYDAMIIAWIMRDRERTEAGQNSARLSEMR